MQKLRFLSGNLANSGNISASSAALGAVGAAVPECLGDGQCYPQGVYGGSDMAEIINIEVQTAGAVDVATIRWGGAGLSAWEASDVVAASTLFSLRDGIQVRFEGDDLRVGDKWQIRTSRQCAPAAMTTDDPGQFWEADGCTAEYIDIALDAPAAVGAVALGYHNLSATATVRLLASATENWADPDLDMAVPVGDRHAAALLTHTSQYWRLTIADAANADSAIQAGLLYLGPAVYLGRNMDWGATPAIRADRTEKRVKGGLVGGTVGAVRRTWSFTISRLDATAWAALEEVWSGCYDGTNGQLRALWFWPNPDDLATLIWGFLVTDLQAKIVQSGGAKKSTSLDIEEYGG